jgi:hypothetical protein
LWAGIGETLVDDFDQLGEAADMIAVHVGDEGGAEESEVLFEPPERGGHG